MSPGAKTLAAGAPVDLDLAKVEPGQQVVALWRGKPVFVVNRALAMLKTLQDPRLTRMLADPQSEKRQQPRYARNWHRSVKPEYGVFVGICTHLGCAPQFDPLPNATQPAPQWPGGYFCPCHGSKYDLAARVYRGVPAPYNLPVPPIVSSMTRRCESARIHPAQNSICRFDAAANRASRRRRERLEGREPPGSCVRTVIPRSCSRFVRRHRTSAEGSRSKQMRLAAFGSDLQRMSTGEIGPRRRRSPELS